MTTASASPCHDCARQSHCLGAALVEGAIAVPTVTRCAIDQDEHLYHTGDAANTLYVIRSGAVKTYVVSEDGEEEIRGFCLANDIAGLDAVCGTTQRTNARAIRRTWVCKLPAAAVRARMSESPTFRDRLLTTLGREFERLHGMLQRERCSADRRVASFLLTRLEAAPAQEQAELDLPMSRTDLARYLDLTTETVSRVFSRLQGRNILRTQGAHCEILDPDALRAVA